METVNIKEAKETIDLAIKSGYNRPIFIQGPPGIGKSDIIQQLAEARIQEDGPRAGEKWGFIDIRLSMYNPTDIRGLPYPNEDHTKANWLTPERLPYVERDGEYGIVILDELPNASHATQAAAYQLVLDRRIESYVFPKNWYILAAGNRKEDKADAKELLAPLKNRFIHMEIEPNFQIWKEWAYNANIHPHIIGFLNYREDLFYNFDPKSQSPSFPTARTWAYASEAMTKVENLLNSEGANGNSIIENRLLFNLISGAIGAGPAGELRTFIQIESKLPDINRILNGQWTDKDIPQEVSVTYMLISKLVYEFKKCMGDTKTVDEIGNIPRSEMNKINNIMSFICTKINEDFATKAAKDILKLGEKVPAEILLRHLSSNAWVNFLKQNMYLFK